MESYGHIEGISYGNVLICVNGQVVNAKVNSDQIPDKYCATCGDQMINKCLECGAFIKGVPRQVSQLHPPYSYFADKYVRQSFCPNCGAPFPWTQRTIEAANELIDFATSLNQEEKGDWKNTIPVLTSDSPKTNVAIAKFKHYAKKAGAEIGKGVHDIVVSVVSEIVKNALLK